MKVYGIKNCDTVKKAIKWLEAQGFTPELHDYRVQGIEADWLAEMAAYFGWENLLNKRSTTWRNLDEAVKNNLTEQTALTLLLEQPTLIKRPIVIFGATKLLGFDEKNYQALLKSNG